MSSPAYDPGRIARNTGFLYLRMVLLAVADLVSVRLVLDALGLGGYELFAAVAGVVSTLRFLNGKLEETAFRFLSLAIGNKADVREAFAGVVLLTVALCAVLAGVGETAFRWFVGTRLALPPGLEVQAIPVFHVGIAVAVVRTLRLPFTSFVIAEEKMGFMAAVSVLEAGLSLAAAGAVGLERWSTPTCYSLLLLGTDVVLLAVYAFRCRRILADLRRGFCVRSCGWRGQGSFFGWSSLSSVAHVLKYQGVCLLPTQCAGAAFAATWRVSMGLGFGLYGVIGNFQQAYAPQFAKLWGVGDRTGFRTLLAHTLRWSFALMAAVAVPIIVFADAFVAAWLGEAAPPQSVAFVRCVMVHFLIDALAAPLHSAIAATGRIVRYQVQVSLVMVSGFVLAAAALAWKLPAWTAMAAVAFSNVLAVVYRQLYVRRFVLAR